MAEKDITERHLASYDDVFADIVNGCFAILGEGRPFRRIEPHELQDTQARTLYKSDGELHEQERDVVKLWKPGETVISLLGLENQTDVDPDMPLRVFGYEGGDYRRQLTRKGVERYPVLTFVLYFGTERRWLENLTLAKRLGIVEPILLHFLNDCRLHVLEVAFLTALQAAHFTSDFRFVVDYLRQVQQNRTFVPSEQMIIHVDAVLKLMSALTGDRGFANIPNSKRGEPMTVRNIFGEVREQGIQIGEARGIQIGEARGIQIGEARGEARGEALMARRLAREMLIHRFGVLSPEVAEGLEQIQDVDRLRHLALNVYQTATLEEFTALLDAAQPH